MAYLNNKNKTLINIAFSTALLILAAIFYFTYQSEKQRQISTNWLLRAHVVLTESERLHSLVKDAQRSQRGYLLTGNKDFLVPYYQAKESIAMDIADLQKLVSEQPQQLERIMQLKKLTQVSLSYWDESIILYEQEGEKAAFNLVRKGIGNALVDEIGLIINGFKDFEQELLQKRQQAYVTSRKKTTLIETVGAVFSIVLLSISFLLLRSRLNREQQLSRTLEEMVLQRTRELQESNQELQNSLHEVSIMNKELQRTNNDLDNFVYTASHDLRSPIINLQGLQRLLLSRMRDRVTPKEQEVIIRMEEATNRLSRTIKDLSEVAKIQKEEHEKDLLSFSDLINEVIEEISALYPADDIRFEIDLQTEHLRYAYSHLRSILYNLISNAVKYRSLENTPYVRISTCQKDDHVVLTVSDNGLGLEPAQIPKLFIMFKRLHNHVEGTGVGLYMIKRIIENNGGNIEVESSPGVGTSFRIHFAHQLQLTDML